MAINVNFSNYYTPPNFNNLNVELNYLLILLNDVTKNNDSNYNIITKISNIIDNTKNLDNYESSYIIILKDIIKAITTNNIYQNYFINTNDFIKTLDNSLTSRNILITINDNINSNDIFTSFLNHNVIVKEFLKSQLILNLNNNYYECYVVNIDSNSTFRYDNYNFNSYTYFNNNYYALKNDGLYLLNNSNKDNNENIKSYLKTKYYDFNTIQSKQLDYCFLIIKNNGQVNLKVIDERNKQYLYKINSINTDEKTRIKFGNNLRSNSFSFELTSEEDFTLDNCTFIPLILNKKT